MKKVPLKEPDRWISVFEGCTYRERRHAAAGITQGLCARQARPAWLEEAVVVPVTDHDPWRPCDRGFDLTHRSPAGDAYGSAEIIKALKAKGTKTFIPLWHGRSGKNSGTAVGLVYERDQDRIRCPAGKYLYPNPGNYENRRRYVTRSGECHDCPLVATCPTKCRAKAPHIRFVLRPMDQDTFDEVQAQMNEPEFAQRASERMWKSEGLFAEAKQFHNLSRAKYRGCAKVQIQALFSAMVQNLKRLLFPLYCWLLSSRQSSRTQAQIDALAA